MHSSRVRHLLGIVAGLLLAAGVSACQSTDTATSPASSPASASASGTAPGSARTATYFAQGGLSDRAYKPRRLNPSADGSLYVTHVHWTQWNNRAAVGTGIAHVNDCTPDCADGHFATHPVAVRLTQPHKYCGSRYFTTFRLTGPAYRTHAHWFGVMCR